MIWTFEYLVLMQESQVQLTLPPSLDQNLIVPSHMDIKTLIPRVQKLATSNTSTLSPRQLLTDLDFSFLLIFRVSRFPLLSRNLGSACKTVFVIIF